MKTMLCALAALLVLGSQAMAQQQCAPYAPIRDRLTTGQYAEIPAARGMTVSGLVLEIFVNDKTGTWTAFVIRPDGLACGAASGTAWEIIAVKPKGDPS